MLYPPGTTFFHFYSIHRTSGWNKNFFTAGGCEEEKKFPPKTSVLGGNFFSHGF